MGLSPNITTTTTKSQQLSNYVKGSMLGFRLQVRLVEEFRIQF